LKTTAYITHTTKKEFLAHRLKFLIIIIIIIGL